MKEPAPKDIDEYIARFPQDVRRILEKIRLTVQQAAPDAVETIKYAMPTFMLQGNLVFFGAFKNHIGFYPPVTGMEKRKNELAAYAGEKGSLQFPLDQPIPYELISAIVAFRVQENLDKARLHKKSAAR